MKVKVKTWTELEKIGKDKGGVIVSPLCDTVFTRQMDAELPESRVIELKDVRGETMWGEWIFEPWMYDVVDETPQENPYRIKLGERVVVIREGDKSNGILRKEPTPAEPYWVISDVVTDDPMYFQTFDAMRRVHPLAIPVRPGITEHNPTSKNWSPDRFMAEHFPTTKYELATSLGILHVLISTDEPDGAKQRIQKALNEDPSRPASIMVTVTENKHVR